MTQSMTGVQRAATELVTGLDELLGEADTSAAVTVTALIPHGDFEPLSLKKIAIETVGRLRGHLWEQTELPRRASGGLLVSLCNLGPLNFRSQVVMIHDAQVFAIPGNFSAMFRAYYRLALPRLGKVARRILTVSEFSRGELARFGVVGRDNCRVIHNGADHIVRQPADRTVLERVGVYPRRYVLAVGSDNQNKNYGLLRTAAPQLARAGLRVLIAGSSNDAVFGAGSSPGQVSGEAVIQCPGLNDSELRALYEGALCLAIPSLYEGFGLAAVEAMRCGCPVLSSRLGSLPEVCGDAALYCDETDATDLQAKILKLKTELALRDEHVQRGRLRSRPYTWRHGSESLLAEIMDLATARYGARVGPTAAAGNMDD